MSTYSRIKGCSSSSITSMIRKKRMNNDDINITTGVVVKKEKKDEEVIELQDDSICEENDDCKKKKMTKNHNNDNNNNKKKQMQKVYEMFKRVHKRMKVSYTKLMKEYRDCDTNDDKADLVYRMQKLKRSLKKMIDTEKSGEHIDMIGRLTADGEDLENNSISSVDVMELVVIEHDMEDFTDNDY